MNTKDFFTKVNLDFSDIDVDDLVLTFSHHYLDNDRAVFVVYHTEFEFVDYIKSRLPLSFQSWIKNVRITEVKGGTLAPHIDFRGSVCINFYLTTGDGCTTFWSANKDAVAISIEGESTNNIYNTYEDLIYECSFIAEKNSCYLLNTGKIHSVSIENKTCIRKILQLTFDPDITYNMVLDKLTELNLIKETE